MYLKREEFKKEEIEELEKLPITEVFRMRFGPITVWTNGKIIRNYVGQDKPSKLKSLKNTHPNKGFKKMMAVLLEEYDKK